MSEPSLHRSGWSNPQVSSNDHLWVFHLRNLSSSSSLLFLFHVPFQLPLPTAFPRSLICRFLGHTTFTVLQVLFGCPTTHMASFPISPPLIGSLIPEPPGNHMSPPGVTHWSSIPCRPQTPWCGGWMRTPSPP